MTLNRLWFAVAVVLLGAASASAATVSGRVTDENGAPLEGVHVEVVYQTYNADDLLTYGESIKATAITSGKGRYSIEIGHMPPGEYSAIAYQFVVNGGHQTIMDLVAEDDSTFGNHVDTVRNFTAGVIEFTEDMPYGNAGIFVLNSAIADYTDLTDAEVTLVNEDTGNTIVRTVRSTGEGLAVTGIPFGTYRASVTLHGQPLQVGLWGPGEDQTLRDSVVHDFTMGWMENQFQVVAKP